MKKIESSVADIRRDRNPDDGEQSERNATFTFPAVLEFLKYREKKKDNSKDRSRLLPLKSGS